MRTGQGRARLANIMGVANSTLTNWRKRRSLEAPPQGRPTWFSKATEGEMAKYILQMCSVFLAFTRKTFQAWAQAFSAKHLGPDSTFVASDGWLDGFLRRNPITKNRRATSLVGKRLHSFNRASVVPWYDEIRDLASAYEAQDIWNCDDTGSQHKFKQRFVRYNCARVDGCTYAIVCVGFGQMNSLLTAFEGRNVVYFVPIPWSPPFRHTFCRCWGQVAVQGLQLHLPNGSSTFASPWHAMPVAISWTTSTRTRAQPSVRMSWPWILRVRTTRTRTGGAT